MLKSLSESASAVTVILAILSLTSTFESFTNAPLIFRLLITGILALLVASTVADRFGTWAKADPELPGFGRETLPTSIKRLEASTVLLILIYLILIGAAWFQTDRYALIVIESRTGDTATLHLKAPSRPVGKMTVPLPGPGSDCDWHSMAEPDSLRLTARTVDWDTPIRKLNVLDFAWPQEIDIECRPSTSLSGRVLVDSGAVEIFVGNERWWWRFWIFILGGLIWSFAMWRLYSSSR
ncbi:hypothetical protein [Inquilinus sp.]|uniref:hypothetical protein n=1 Tax=Inquilinus sp. TaxID=1932117 RepID=UPI0031D07C8E